MRIFCYFINFNDSFYIPFFAKHYFSFCERIVMYDQYSTDGSIELAQSLGIEVRNFGRPGVLNDQWYLDVKNNCWKECRNQGIDYVIVVDVDEFVMLPNELTKPFPWVHGYNMISENLPTHDMFEISTGEPSEQYGKQAIFNPDFVTEINYVHGCHKHNAILSETSSYKLSKGVEHVEMNDSCSLYHYRQIGGVQRIIDRHAMYRNRLSEFNKKNKMGFHYNHSDNAKRDEWEFNMSKAKELW